jgi:tetratricopeptide (TPR) repeat protein
MLTGVHPFRKATQAETINAIFNEGPPGIATYSKDTSDILQHTVQRLLVKAPERRYQSIHEVITNLDQLTEDTGRTGLWPVVKAKFYLNLRWVVAVALIVAVAVTALVIWNLQEPLWARHGTVLADFDTGDPAFDQVLKDTLENELDKTGKNGITFAAGPGVRKSMLRPPDSRITPEVARDICERLGKSVQTYFHGTLVPLEDTYQLTLNASWCKGWQNFSRTLSEQRTAASKDEVVEVLRDATYALAERVVYDLKRFEPRPGLPNWRWAPTPSNEALRLLGKGVKAYVRGDNHEAIPFLQKAIEYDSEYTAAHKQLALAYAARGQISLARLHAQRAWENRDRIEGNDEQGAVDDLYCRMVHFNLDEAIKSNRMTVERYGGVYRWLNLANSLLQVGQLEEGLEANLEGLRLSRLPMWGRPLRYPMAANFLVLNQLAEAKAHLEEFISNGYDEAPRHRDLWITALLQNDQEAMRRHARWVEDNPGEDGMLFLQLHEAFYRGQFQVGRQLLDDLILLIHQQKRSELADRVTREQAWVEGIVGNDQLVSEYFSFPIDVEATHLEQIILSAYILALQDKGDQAEDLLQSALELYPEATLLKNLHTPTIRALNAHRKGDIEAALRKLRTTAQYEKAPEADKFKLLSGQILLDSERGGEAVEAFRKILDYPGQITFFFLETPVSSWIEIPVAQVGLARAKAFSGDIEGARAAYEEFFQLWKDADEDIPLLTEAKAEYNKLTTDN